MSASFHRNDDCELQLHLDFETTDQHPMFGRIVEVGAILTDANLVELGRFESLVDPGEWGRSRMTPGGVVARMHAASGLLDELAAQAQRPEGVPSLRTVEDALLALLDAHPASSVVLAGSGVGAFDLQFIRFQMPRLAERLQHFPADVGQLRRAWRRAANRDLVDVNTRKPHRAIVDIELHLEEARAFARALEAAAAFVHTATPQEVEARIALYRGQAPAEHQGAA